jgi:hypothetical protein
VFLSLVCWTHPALAQLSKGHQILLAHGLQVQGLAQDDCYLTLNTYTNLNYNAVDWVNGDSSGNPVHLGQRRPRGLRHSGQHQPGELDAHHQSLQRERHLSIHRLADQRPQPLFPRSPLAVAR